jgi:peptidoglycan/LPS O-acetylase OafA/YrhL
MCWSATADLAAGAGIAAVGVACVTRVRRARDLPLAALPLLLGAHQIVESVVWDAGGGTGPATVAWSVIALPLLAVWVPAGVLCAAPRPARPRLAVLLAVGLATAAALVHALATRPVRAEIRGHTLGYVVDLAHPELLVAGYLLVTIGSFLLSGDRRLVLLGVMVCAGAAVCWALWELEFVSTWCAFAALCSVVLFGWVRRQPDAKGGAGR